MSNSQNKKNEQQNNLCTTLTEQWEKGELEIDKNYYLRFADGTEEIQLYIGAFLMRADNEVVEVLAPVPSYDEWQSLNELLDSMRDTNKVLAHKLNNIKVNGNYPDKISKLKSRIKGLLEENEKLKKWCEEFNALDVAKENDKLKTENKWYSKQLNEAVKEVSQLKTQIAKLTEIVGVLPSNHSVGNLGYKIKNQRHEINNRLKDIDKLKELLRECVEVLNDAQRNYGYDDSILDICSPIITKIDNAIGEKK